MTTQGAPGASGPEHPRSSARGTAPLGRAGRLLAPTPPCCVLKGAGSPTRRTFVPLAEKVTPGTLGSLIGPLEAFALHPTLSSKIYTKALPACLLAGGGPHLATTLAAVLPVTSRLAQDTLSCWSTQLGPRIHF